MRNKIKLLLLWIITPLLCLGVSFGANSVSLSNINSINANYINSFHWDAYNVCFQFKDLTDYVVINYSYSYNQTLWSALTEQWTMTVNDNWIMCFPLWWLIMNSQNYMYEYEEINYNSFQLNIANANQNSNAYILVSLVDAFGSDCSSVASDLTACKYNYDLLSWQFNTCINNLNTSYGTISTLSWSLASCNSDLASCTNSCDTLVSQCQEDKATLQGVYSGCLESNTSLQNYNDSLSSQLQECLESGTGGTWGTYIALYDLFWSEGGNNYSLPVENNIWLPNGYRGYIDQWVLAIKHIDSLENAYSINDSDFTENVVWSYSVVYLFFVSSGLFLVFLYIIRRYFIWLKSAK